MAEIETTRRSKSSWLGEAEPDFDRVELRRQGSNLRFAINSRASYRSTTPERESGRRGSRTPKAEAHPFSRRDTAPLAVLPKVTPAGVEPACGRLRVGCSAV